ncbi:hypothetical protein Micbo1qcDRAFT_203567 [Microdochium bolleyi]|uniref:Thaumatin family-domain-containing protein n=1 Tax=Microdochium bolleyi TaxID=196109 RepID=A0A136J8M4_9PEZI|nr:hypothetical protein Micbo1qcDRAFT_203567 [Microdochium bolleyi]
MTHISFRSLASIAAILVTSSSLTVLAAPPAAVATKPPANNNVLAIASTASRTAAPSIKTTNAAAAAPVTTIPPINGVAVNSDGSGIGVAGGGENLIPPSQLSSHAQHGALNLAAIKQPPPNVMLAAALNRPPQYLTIRIVNKHARPLSTTHARNWDSPTAVGGLIPPGTIATKATTSFVVPTNWAGMVAVGEARRGTPRDASLIEANFVYVADYGMAVATVDISYVDAFTVPIVCSCSGRVVTGCNKGLWGMSTCPDKATYGACLNPTRPFPDGTTASSFFAPCRAAAYTFAKDDLATSWGDCQSGIIRCCVGKRCAPNPEQPARRDPSAAGRGEGEDWGSPDDDEGEEGEEKEGGDE